MFRLCYCLLALLPLVTCQLYQTWVGNWVDPSRPTTLRLNTNVTSVLRVGDVVQFNCTAINHSSSVGTLEWKRVIGTAEWREIAGHSPLSWTKTITATDHGTQVFCGTGFSDSTSSGINAYYARSDSIKLQVQGVTNAPVPPNSRGEMIYITIRPEVKVSKVGDVLEYVCNVGNMENLFPAIEMKQSKGHFERKLYFGYQTGFRWMKHKLSQSDENTSVMCQAWVYDRAFGTYAINSESIPLNIQ